MHLKSVFTWILIQSVISAIAFSPAFSSVVPKNSQADISGNLETSNEFIPGFGQPVGEVTLSIGKVVITHSKSPQHFSAKKGLPLYNGDTLSTGKSTGEALLDLGQKADD